MLQLFKKIKSIALLLIAVLFFGQALSYANVTQADSGPLAIVTTVRNKTDDTSYLNQINAKPGDQVSFRLFVKNESNTEDLTVRVNTQLDQSLEYVPDSTQMVFNDSEETDLVDGITTVQGIELPVMVPRKTAYVYFLAKVKDGATGTLSQTSHVVSGDYSATDSTAKVVIGGTNQEIAPKMIVDTAVTNMGTNPHQGYNSAPWVDTVNANVGETIGVSILVFNDQPAGVNSQLKNTTLKQAVSDIAGGFRVLGTAKAINHAQVGDNATIKTNGAKLAFVSGSGRMYFTDASGTRVSMPISDEQLTGTVSLYEIPAGGQDAGVDVFFQMRVNSSKTTGTINFTKHLDKGSGWILGPDEDKQVDFVLTLPSGLEQTVRTNTSGAAELTDMPFGNYKVREIIPAGYDQIELTPSEFTLSIDNSVQLVTAQNAKKVVVTPTPTPSVTPTPTPTPSVTPTPTPSITPTPTPTPSVTPTPTPSPKVPALQIAKYVGNATKNEATDKTSTKAVAGDVLNWRVVIKNVGDEMIRNLRTNDVLPANVRVTTDFVITRDGNRFKLIDFTRQAATIGDLAPGKEVTIEFGTAISRDVACGNELVNTAFAEADNHGKIRSEAKAKIECVAVAGAQQPLVKTGSSELALSMILSLLSVAGYYYQRQRKQVAKLFHSF